MAKNSPGAQKKIARDPAGSWERRFRNILGASWELGAWEFIAQNGLLGGHLGNQNHCLQAAPPAAAGATTRFSQSLPHGLTTGTGTEDLCVLRAPPSYSHTQHETHNHGPGLDAAGRGVLAGLSLTRLSCCVCESHPSSVIAAAFSASKSAAVPAARARRARSVCVGPSWRVIGGSPRTRCRPSTRACAAYRNKCSLVAHGWPQARSEHGYVPTPADMRHR